MRIAMWLVLAVASLSVVAAAEKTHKIRVKPSHQGSAANAKSSVPARVSRSDDALAHQLRAAEQSGAKVGPSKGVARHRVPTRMTASSEKPNPPIRFSTAASSGHAMQNNQGVNPYKGRLKQKHAGK